jgi:hypothetical protein
MAAASSISSTTFNVLDSQEAEDFQNCLKNILHECWNSIFRGRKEMIEILPVFFKLFSIGFPFMVWYEFYTVGKKNLSELKNRNLDSSLWPTIVRIFEITNEMHDPRDHFPTMIKCGVTADNHEFDWLTDMRCRMTQQELLFTPIEISDMIYSIQEACGKCVADRMRSSSLNPSDNAMLALQNAFAKCMCDDRE